MCGLYGAFGNVLFMGDHNFFKQAAIASMFRGTHSTGAALVGSNGGAKIHKQAVDALTFMNSKETDTFWKDHLDDAVGMLGHVRYATIGNVNKRNAHPFKHGSITLAHNGSVINHKALSNDTKIEVDSEHICSLINERGIEYVAKELQGAFALTWHDSKDNTFNIIRNSERPLSVVKHRHREVYYYASEQRMLEWLLHRNHITDYESVFFNVGEQLKFSFNQKKMERIDRKLYTWKSNYGLNNNDYWEGNRNNADWRFHKQNGVYGGDGGYQAGRGNNVQKVTNYTEWDRLKALGDQFLKRCDSAKNKGIQVYLYEWEPYNGNVNNPYGYAIGCFMGQGSANCKIVIDGVSKISMHSNYEFSDGYYTAIISHAKFDPKGNEYIIHCGFPKYLGDVYQPEHEVKELYEKKAFELLALKTRLTALPGPTSEATTPPPTSSFDSPLQSHTQHFGSKEEIARQDAEIEERMRNQLSNSYVEPDPIQAIVGELVNDDPIIGPNNRWLSSEEWDKLTKNGCSMCTCDLLARDCAEIAWKDSETPICPDCLREELVDARNVEIHELARAMLH